MSIIKRPPDEVDVLIVGCGPSGIAAASVLVKSGINVLIVDARERIGHPLRCGELTRSDYFKYFGIEPQQGWIRGGAQVYPSFYNNEEHYTSTQLNISPTNMGESKGNGAQGWILLDRQKSEFEASRILAEKGALVLENASVNGLSSWSDGSRLVTIKTQNGDFKIKARMVIAADGPSSTLLRFINLGSFLSPAEVVSYYAYQVKNVEPLNIYKLGLFRTEALNPFYFWIFPNGETSANIGLGMHGYRGHLAKSYLDKVVKDFSFFSQMKINQTIIGWTPSTGPLYRPYDDGIIFVGGAARYTGSLTGEGLWQAVISGNLAGSYYAQNHHLEPNQENLSGYSDSIRMLTDLQKEDIQIRKSLEFGL